MAATSRPYRIDGHFLELCDCYAICPCWLGRAPDDNRCTGAFAWSIRAGDIDGVDIANRQVVSVSFHTGHRETGGQEVFLFIDERASDRQYEALGAVFTGKAGGPLAELGTLMGVLRAVERAAITIAFEGHYASLTVDNRISGDARVLIGADKKITELHHGRLALVLGPVGEVGTSSAFRVDFGGLGHSIDVKNRSSMRGPFRYEHDGARA